MAAATRIDLAAQIAHSRELALRFAQKASIDRLQTILETARSTLQARIDERVRAGARDTFTAVHAQTALVQLRAVLGPVTQGMHTLILETGAGVASESARSAVAYVRAAEERFHGIGAAAALPIHEASILDAAVSGTRASQLRRLMSSGAPGADLREPHAGKAGILRRYGENVVEKFEGVLQQRYLARKPWGEVRQDLVAASPFLAGKEPGVATTWAERILRTETAYANNAANKQALVEMNDALGDMVNILAATFDSVTASDSYAVHGQIRRLTEPFDSWFGQYMHPPNRPNDREGVIGHRMSWPLPEALAPKSDGDILARWQFEGRKGSPPPRPVMSTIPREQFGKPQPPPAGAATPPAAAPEPEAAPEAPTPKGKLGTFAKQLGAQRLGEPTPASSRAQSSTGS